MSKWDKDGEQSLESAFREYSEHILRQIRGKIQNPDDAADLTQEVFLRAQDALPKFRGESKLHTWLSRIAANVCVDAGRSAARRAKRETLELSDDQHPPVIETNFVGSLLDDEQQGHLHEVLTELPPDELLLLSLRYSDQLTNKEIADVLGVQEWDVVNRLRALRTRIDRALKFKDLVAERQGNRPHRSMATPTLDGLVVEGEGTEQVYYNLGTLYLQKGLVEAAIREWRKAHELAPDFIEPCLAIADQYAATHRPAEAVAYLAEVVRDVKSPELHTRLGESYVGIRSYREAIYHCQQAIKLKPDYARAYCILGKINRRLAMAMRSSAPLPTEDPSADTIVRKRLVKSLSYLKKALELDPRDAGNMAELVRTVMLMGKIPDTITICEKMLKRYPEDAYVQYAAAQVYEVAGRYDDACALYLKALERDKNPWIRIRLTGCYNKSGEFNEAIKLLKKLAASEDAFEYLGSVYSVMASSYIGVGMLDEACDVALKAYESGQEPVDSCCRYATALVLQGQDLDMVEHLCQEGLEVDKRHLCFHMIRSRAQLLTGRVEQALASARKVVELMPDAPEAQAQFGCAALAAGETEDAEIALRTALNFCPDHPDATYALRMLKSGEALNVQKLVSTKPRPHLAYCMKGGLWL